MKKLLVLALLLAIAGSASAVTLGTWGSKGAGLWSDGSKWSSGSVPALPTTTSDEVKIQSANADVTIDNSQLSDYNCRITMGGASGVIIRIVDGANFGMGEARVGAKVSSTTSGYATLYQTGGTLTTTDLLVGRGAGTTLDSAVANGTYEISGGLLQYRSGGAGRLYIGAGVNTNTESPVENFVGSFIVIGSASTINFRKLYVGSDGTRYGTGNLEFRIGEDGVSRITVADASGTILDGGAGNGIANLVLSMLGDAPAGNIVLVENLGTGAVSGTFDRLNGVVGAAAQGAEVLLGGNTYTLSYVYDAVSGMDGNGNDIALVLVPEPASIAILGMGAFLLRRRFA